MVASQVPALVLLDRDGTVNVKAADGEYILVPDELQLLPGAGLAIARLNAARIPVVLITNQRGIARGLMTEDDLAAVHRRLADLLAAEGAHVDDIRYCPHDHGACRCRKPQPGMLLDALQDHSVDAMQAVMIGDAASDMEAGRRAGVRAISVGGDATLAAAVDALLAGT